MKTKINFDELLGKPSQLYQKYHEKTKLKKKVIDPDPKDWPKTWTTIYSKSYPRLNEILLPKPSLTPISFKKTLSKRGSKREFSKKPLELKKISALLYYSAGLKNVNNPYGGRFYPSGGARYPLEVYFLSLNTELPKGLYHYYLKNNSLEELLLIDNISIYKYISPQKWIKDIGGIIIVSAVFKRNTMKYGERGYRLVLTESGLLLQNLYLNAAALDINCCAVGSYIDDRINKLLDVDGLEESVLNVLLIGNP